MRAGDVLNGYTLLADFTRRRRGAEPVDLREEAAAASTS